MRKREYRANWCLRIAMILLCLTMLSTRMVAGMYARFSTSASASDSARVSKWSVASSMADQEAMALTTDAASGEKEITLTNASEVAVRFDVMLTADKPLLADTVLTIGGQIWTVTDQDNMTHTFYGIASAAPGGEAKVKLIIDSEKAAGNFDGSIAVSVNAEQID